jgi:hypothetical protein
MCLIHYAQKLRHVVKLHSAACALLTKIRIIYHSNTKHSKLNYLFDTVLYFTELKSNFEYIRNSSFARHTLFISCLFTYEVL